MLDNYRTRRSPPLIIINVTIPKLNKIDRKSTISDALLLAVNSASTATSAAAVSLAGAAV